MLLNLKRLGAHSLSSEEALGFSHSLDLSRVRLWGERPFKGPVLILGEVVCRAGVYTLSYTAGFKMIGACSRCLDSVEKDFTAKYEHTVLIDAEDEDIADGFILAPGGELDLDLLVTSDILLRFGGVMLCSENCPGLCPKCGKSLNEGACSCEVKELDSRFDVIRKLMEEKG